MFLFIFESLLAYLCISKGLSQRSSTGGPRPLGGPQRYCRGLLKYCGILQHVDEIYKNLDISYNYCTVLTKELNRYIYTEDNHRDKAQLGRTGADNQDRK